MAKIKNAPDTGDLKANDYTEFSSWIAYWESKKKSWRMSLLSKHSPSKFKCCKCGREFAWSEFDGAHVVKVDSADQSLYIYPLCQECNRGKDETPFEAISQLLLPMPEKKE